MFQKQYTFHKFHLDFLVILVWTVIDTCRQKQNFNLLQLLYIKDKKQHLCHSSLGRKFINSTSKLNLAYSAINQTRWGQVVVKKYPFLTYLQKIPYIQLHHHNH